MSPLLVAYLLWWAFTVSWYGSMWWMARAVDKISLRQRCAYLLVYLVGFTCLFAETSWLRHLPVEVPDRLRRTLLASWHEPVSTGYALVVLEGIAFVLAWWARVHLGRLWSPTIALRDGHRVVATGPYRWMRHPMAAGIIGACWTYALLTATPAGFLGAVLLTMVMVIKASAEERFLRRELPLGEYDRYAATTPMFVPWHRRYRRRRFRPCGVGSE